MPKRAKAPFIGLRVLSDWDRPDDESWYRQVKRRARVYDSKAITDQWKQPKSSGKRVNYLELWVQRVNYEAKYEAEASVPTWITKRDWENEQEKAEEAVADALDDTSLPISEWIANI